MYNNYNTLKCGGFAKPRKHWIGAVIGTGLSIANALKARKDNALAKRAAENQYMAQLSAEDQYLLDEYPTTGNEEVSGFYSKGGKIYIKPSKRGTFTTAAKKRGMGVQEFASKVMSNKENYSSAMVKKANFAKNASKWKHENGGNLVNPYKTTGGDLIPISDSMDMVDGNTHEQSRIDNTNGVKLFPNNSNIPIAEVEDEEVVKDNEKVYSDRLKLDNGKTYAEEANRIAKKIKEAEDILNDPNAKWLKKNGARIRKQNWERAADDLFNHQEQMKQEKGITENSDMLPKGQDGINLKEAANTVGTFNNLGDTGYSSNINNAPKRLDFSKIAPYLDNITNAVLTATTPRPAFPLLARARKLKTDYNVDASLSNVTDTVNQITSGIERGTSSSNVAQQRVAATRLAGMKEKGNIMQQKENIETDLYNKDVLNKQQVEGQNLARIQNFADQMTQRAYNMQGRVSANVANIVEDSNKKEISDMMQKYQDEQLQTIKDTYSVEGTGLRINLDNEYEIEYLKNNPIFKDNAAKDYLAKNADGTYKYPKEANRFLQQFPEYINQSF